MLRPIKSILAYLQLNTNASSLASPSSTNMSDDIVENTDLTLTSSRPSDSQNEDAETTISISTISSSRKTPHDQNENVVMPLDDVEQNLQRNENTKEEEEIAIVPGDDLKCVIDLTESVGNQHGDYPTTKDSDSASLITIDNPNAEIGRRYDSTEEDVDNNEVGHGSEEDICYVSDEDKDSSPEIFVISTGPERVTDDTESVICDNEDQDEEDGSRAELLDLSLESNEVIILEENDHNDSITDPLNDPLAIDDYNADVSNNIVPTCGGTTHCDTSTEGELLFSIDTRRTITTDPLSKTTNSRYNQRSRRENYGSGVVSTTEEQEARSDGSDSGLGSETSTLQSANTSSVIDSPVCKSSPPKSNLKRRLDSLSDGSSSNKRQKKSIHFNGVKVYYFPRIQGFGCVPSQGGCTLGMAAHHVQFKTFTLAEHTAEQRRVHKQQMQEINPRSSSSDDTDSDEEISEGDGSDLDTDANGFLQPVPARQRRAILKAAGVRKIDPSEKNDCRAIRSSREFCGCNCRGYCDPDTCSCSQAGIKCQVDRPNFPCGCTRDGCANVIGRVEFNPSRVRTHYIHTIMRLDLENKQKRAMQVDTSSTSSTMLSYGSNTVTSNNLCSYNSLVNTNHMRPQQPTYNTGVSDSGQSLQQQDPVSGYVNNGSNIYPNRGVSTSNLMPVDASSTLLRHRLVDNGGGVGDSLNMGLQNITNHSHDVDLQYAFRDDTSANVDLGSHSSNSNNILALGDYTPTNTLYHEVYNGHSFLSQNYTNTNFCQSQGSEYQQSFISYAPPAATNTVDIADLTADSPINGNDSGTICTDSSYISLNSAVGNQSRVDDINDLLHNSRNVSAKVTTDCVSNDSTSSVLYNMAPSAQTSTSITEGTMTTTTQPQISKPSATFNSVKSELTPVVDLTEGKTQQEKNGTESDDGSGSKDDIVEVRIESSLASIVDLTDHTTLEKSDDVNPVNGSDEVEIIYETVTAYKIDVESMEDSVRKEITESLQSAINMKPNMPSSSSPTESVLDPETDVNMKTSVSPAMSIVSIASPGVDENLIVESVIA